MRIAQIAPLYESVPPVAYGGTERVVHYLTEELVAMGHDVTLFASGDSRTSARLVPCSERSLRQDPSCADPLAWHMAMLSEVTARQHEFDVLHFHIDYLHFPVSRALNLPQVTTLHGRLDLPELDVVYRAFSDLAVVSISDAQRKPISAANWVGTVHHGLPLDEFTLGEKPSDYFAFVGRMSPEKRVDRAIEIAKTLGIPLKIAAKIDKADQAYHESVVAPLLDHPLVEFLGEADERTKGELLAGARALLFPIDWPEPFGLVMIEALACGAPVIAFRHGSVPEVIDHGTTGYVVDDMDAAVRAAAAAHQLSRRRIREVFETRFSSRRMAQDYLRLYERLARARVEAV